MPLNSRQFETFQRIVAIPSPFTQIDPVGDETELQETIWGMLEDPSVRLSKQVINEGQNRFNIIAQKGATIEEAKYVVMVYVHTDTIKKKFQWKDMIDYKLVRDGDLLRGIGAYDMKAGVMLLIDLLQTVELPEGVTLVGAFCCGEERDSDGIRKLMEWPHIHRVNVVHSPEIGAMGNDPRDDSIMLEKDYPKDIIVGRPGNVKSNLVVTVQDSHAYKTDVPDAVDAWRHLANHLKQQLSDRTVSKTLEHPDFGKEFLRFRHANTAEAGEFESVATEMRSRLAIRIHPPTSIESIRVWQQNALDLLVRSEHWSDYGIDAQFTEAGMSYNPYIIRTDSPDVLAVANAVEEHYGAYRFSVSQAIADGAFGHFEMNRRRGIVEPRDFNQYAVGQVRPHDQPVPEHYVPWLDIGPLGQGAHKKSERVYEESLVKLIEFYRQYLIDYLLRYLNKKEGA